MSDDSEKKKDLTGILELSALMPPQSQEELLKQDPFAVNEIQAVEQIDDFASIDQIGMMDHEPASHEASETPVEEAPPSLDENADPFAVSGEAAAEDPFPVSHDAPLEEDPFAVAQSENLLSEGLPSDLSPGVDEFPTSQPSSGDFSFTGDPAPENSSPTLHPFPEDPFADPVRPPAKTGIEGIKNYSERAREATFSANARSPFHLWMHGTFDPYSRDKLLLFITENPMGLNSSELDRQINAGRVLFPRISEFAGIKLIQDLRDSGLSFKLAPSSRDEDEVLPEAESLRLAYEANPTSAADHVLPVFPDGADPALWQAFDSIQLVQFLKAEILEVERSELFQDLLERMTVSLKQKAKLRGATAISALKHELKPLRLPSQYQIELKATLLKKL